MSEAADSVAHEKAFHDALLKVMQSAQRPASAVEVHLAGPLIELFNTWPLQVLLLHSEPREGETPFFATHHSGAIAEEPTLGEALGEEAVQALVETLETPEERKERHKGILSALKLKDAVVDSALVGHSSADASDWKAIVLWSAVRRADATIHLQEAWIVFGSESPPDANQVRWFSGNARSRETLIAHLMALRGQRLLPDLTQQVKAIIAAENDRLGDRLEQASRSMVRIVREQSFIGPHPGYLGLAEDLGIWTVQAILGSGWGVRTFGGNAGKRSVGILVKGLSDLAKNLKEPEQSNRLSALSQILDGLLNPRHEDFGGLPVSSLQQLAAWTRMHEIARAVAQDRDDWEAADDLCWTQICTEARLFLAQTLADPDGAGNTEIRFGQGDLADSRNWLRLWFCHGLLANLMESDPRITGTLCRQLRADLAYVLRESLRLRLFGRRPDYSFQPSAYSASLRTLVEYHSVYVIGLSAGHDIARHLRDVAEAPRPDRIRFAAGHLQHILETYICGQFLCSLEIQADDGEVQTLAGVLAGRNQSDSAPGPQTIADFRQAFSLAVLFHDVGMVLFPDLSPPNEGIAREERDLLKALQTVQETLVTAGQGLIHHCAEELRRAGWVDLTQDPALLRWLEDQIARGEPDHALLGAWYLHCTCRPVSDINPEVVRDAVRAVLLHGVPTRTITVDGEDSDPVAALLVLCDELFEWLPIANVNVSPNAVGRSRHSLTADQHPSRSRARRIRLRDLSVVANDSEIHATLLLDKSRRQQGWPALDIVLEPVEFQDAPIYETWLAMTQNLRRIRKAASGWGPEVMIYAEVPPRLRDLKVVGTRNLLERVVRSIHARKLPFAASLEMWLSDSSRFPDPVPDASQRRRKDARLREQCLLIRAEGKAFHQRDVRQWFPLLMDAVGTVLTEWEGGKRR